jgi:glyoxylase-like metal-dependent hydrolase (beta-lactamase superfamily II)
MPSLPEQPSQTSKPPRVVLPETAATDAHLSEKVVHNRIFAFPPNRDTLGGTSYFIVRNEGNILIDSPSLDQSHEHFLRSQGGVKWLYITHRGAIGKATELQQILGCEILIQEQEAYLLPGTTVTTFGEEFTIDSQVQVLWTPGHSPGSSCLYYKEFGGVLFSGRHLLPNQQGQPVPLRIAKTFHWPRQLKSIQSLRDRFTPETLHYICPGANTGYLRGKRVIEQAYHLLSQLDLESLKLVQPIL